MKIYKYINLEDFDAWNGGEDTKERIIEAGKDSEFNDLINDIFPHGIEETQLNDLLWFEREYLYDSLNIDDE